MKYKYLIITLFAGFVLSFQSCNNNSTEEIEPLDPKFTDLKISTDFNFETTHSVLIDLEVERSSINEPPHKFYIYNSNPNENGKLLSSGITDAYLSYQTILVLPLTQQQIWVRKKDINGGIVTVTLDISSSSINYTFSSINSPMFNKLKSSKAVLNEDFGCSDCEIEINGSHENLTISGETFCVKEGDVLSVQNLTLSDGGVLRVCGTAHFTNIGSQGQLGGKILVSSSGEFTCINLNTNKLVSFVNFGTASITSNLTIHQSCFIENHNILNISGHVNNNNMEFANVGLLNIDGSLNNNSIIYNGGSINIMGDVNNNGNGEIYNLCKIKITGNFNQNNVLQTSSYIEVGGKLQFNGSSETTLFPQALISCNSLTVNGDIFGPDVPCSKIDITDETRINGGANLSGYIDICAENGIESNDGNISEEVSFDCSCFISETDCNPGSGTDPGDGDKDGCPDDQDEYPDDPERCSNEYYPNETDFTNFAFEDLWPALGDYDFNDLIVEANYKMVKNGKNRFVELFARFHISAVGADLNNGFAIELDVPAIKIDTVLGSRIDGNAVGINDNGTEAGVRNKAVIIVYDAITKYLNTSMVNTIPGGNYMDIDTTTVYVKFVRPRKNIGVPPFNPFMFINQERGKEIHMIDHFPTELVDTQYFGQDADNSNPSTGDYYLTSTRLPWVIEVPVSFDYPIEKADILTAHLKFKEWAESSGQLYPDWYLDNPNYRDDKNIYQKP